MHRSPPIRAAFAVALTTAIFVAACRPPASAAATTVQRTTEPDTARIRAHVAHLASDSLGGRGTGTAGNDSAAMYLAREYARLRLEPLGDGDGDGAVRYLQRFTARSVAAAHAGLPGELPTQNVVAVLRGRDPALRDEYVVVGAHFDHLGTSTFGALDPAARDAIRNGADDNASGTAAILEMARLLSQRPPARSVIFVAFGGEELGLLGSQHFVEHPPVPLDRIVAMINFDMVGRMRDDKLIVYGVATATELPAIVDSANAARPLAISAVGGGFGSSDHSSFYARDIPVLHLFTDLHEDYHRATDDAHKVNVAGIGRVVAFAERLTRRLAAGPRLTPVRSAQPPRTTVSSSGSEAWFGSIPDMGASDVVGVRLAGVTPGGPAEQAGARTGDVIVQFGGTPVRDLYEFTDALRARAPGDVVELVVERDGRRLTLTATLRKRGG